jgi:hypothetical protein
VAILNGATVAIGSADGEVTELTGPVAAFKDSEGWWAGLITTSPSVPPKSELVGQRVQIKAAGIAATACVSDRVELLGAPTTVQVLMRGEGPAPFLTNGKM